MNSYDCLIGARIYAERTDNRWFMMVYLALGTGLRRGETTWPTMETFEISEMNACMFVNRCVEMV